jgi:hypothetical protein
MNDRPIRDLTELLLHRVRNTPGMSIGVWDTASSMFTLGAYLSGYEACYRMVHDMKGDRYLDRFTDWIYAKTGAPQGALRLGPIIDDCEGDQLLALKRFFEYLEIFDREVPFVERAPLEG